MGKEKKAANVVDTTNYQKSFDNARSLQERLDILHQINTAAICPKSKHNFFKKNWSSFIPLIYNHEEAMRVFIFFSLCSTQRIYSTVIALKGIQVWLKNKSAETITAEYRDMLQPFESALNQPLQVEVAKDILEKLER